MTSLSLKRKISNLALILFLLILANCTYVQYVEILSEQPIKIYVESARTSAEQARGLMFRETLDKNKGMLFVFDDEQPRTFWMKNTKIPLDIIFISADKKIADIKKNFMPCKTQNCETHMSKPAKYALEVNAGIVDENKITIGDAVTLSI